MSEQLRAAIIQDDITNRILMLGWMDDEALELTKSTGYVHFFSRSRQQLWKKGETSGNTLRLREIVADCDDDALLVRVEADGPTCHDGSTSCFTPWLWRKILQREASGDESSYVVTLLNKGVGPIAQKVGEEAIETVIAAKNDDLKDLEGEASDLLFHLMVLLRAKKTSLKNVVKKLESRHQK